MCKKCGFLCNPSHDIAKIHINATKFIYIYTALCKHKVPIQYGSKEMIDFESLPSDFAKWPFSSMMIGDVVPIEDMQGKSKIYIQRMCHNYACGSGKRFKTKTSGGKLYVKRVA